MTAVVGVWAGIASLSVRTLLRLPRLRGRGPEVMQAIAELGVGSLPVVAVSTLFAGLVVSFEIAWHMDRALHTVSMIPGFSGQFILRELGVVIPALLLVSKAGASMTAEVSNMKITDQLDALRVLKIDPVDYVVLPRFVAMIVSCVCLTVISVCVTLAGALTVAVISFGFDRIEYMNMVAHFVTARDIGCALIKSAVFGAVIPLVACGYGFQCKGGAEGVGNATTDSVVTSTVAVIVLDFALTFAFVATA